MPLRACRRYQQGLALLVTSTFMPSSSFTFTHKGALMVRGFHSPMTRLGAQLRDRSSRPSRAPPTTVREASSLDTLFPPLSFKQVLDFEREGHMLLRGLLNKQEMACWTPALMKAFQDEELEAYKHEVRVFFGDEAFEAATSMDDCKAALAKKEADDNTPFLQVFNLWRRHSNLKAFSLAKRFGSIAAQLLGVERVRLYQDSMFVKRSGDGPTLFHTDLGTSPLDTNHMLTFWIPLVPVPKPEDGGSPLCFATGSHRDLSFSYWWGPHNDDDDLLDERYHLHDYGALSPGDATIHHGWCLHASPPNELPSSRVAFSLAFIADGARTIPETAEYEPDAEDTCSYDEWIGDMEPGEVIDHPLVPIVFP